MDLVLKFIALKQPKNWFVFLDEKNYYNSFMDKIHSSDYNNEFFNRPKKEIRANRCTQLLDLGIRCSSIYIFLFLPYDFINSLAGFSPALEWLIISFLGCYKSKVYKPVVFQSLCCCFLLLLKKT